MQTALTICNTAIRNLDGLFSLNDLHQAAGGAVKHQPTRFIRLDQTQALVSELHSPEMVNGPVSVIKGSVNPGTYACRELVIAYAAWISPAFHLKVIRHFLDTKVGAGETAAALPNAISREQAGELATLIAERFPNGTDRPYAWGRFNNHFRLASYKDLPHARFSEACAYIRGMPRKEAPALPAPAGHRPMKPPVVTKTSGSHTGAVRNLNTVKQLINELQMWGYDELPRDVANAFHECLYELNALLVTGWTEVDEALQCLHRAQRYLSRWQGSPL